MIDKEITELANQLGKFLNNQNLKMCAAESCTGGGIAFAITDIPGSSAWFDRGFVIYSNAAKLQMLKVKQNTLDEYGAVSKEVAIEMTEGALHYSDSDLAVSVTGIAGPDGGTKIKPVGTVYIAWQYKGQDVKCIEQHFSGDREQIRQQTIRVAILCCLGQKDMMDNTLSLYQKSEKYLISLLKQQLPEHSRFFLFGSRAKGTNGEMADIDIGIISKSALPLELVNTIKEEIEESFVPYDVDLVDFKTVSEPFKKHALKKTIPWN